MSKSPTRLAIERVLTVRVEHRDDVPALYIGLTDVFGRRVRVNAEGLSFVDVKTLPWNLGSVLTFRAAGRHYRIALWGPHDEEAVLSAVQDMTAEVIAAGWSAIVEDDDPDPDPDDLDWS